MIKPYELEPKLSIQRPGERPFRILVTEEGRRPGELMAWDFVNRALYEAEHSGGKKLVIATQTGATALPFQEALVEANNHGQFLFSTLVGMGIVIDEFAGAGLDTPWGYLNWQMEKLYKPVGMNPTKILCPGPDNFLTLDQTIERLGGIDFAFGGIGLPASAHYAFHETGVPLKTGCHLATLHEATKAANQDYMPPGMKVPDCGYTLGVATVVSHARHICIAAEGESKIESVVRALTGPIAADCPQSGLRIGSPDTIPELVPCEGGTLTYVICPQIWAALEGPLLLGQLAQAAR
ncbi:hypothetical protein JNK13_08980 [bacterium]|nr:hypothetical protein [bacterium]